MAGGFGPRPLFREILLSYYNELLGKDVIEWVRPLLEKKVYIPRFSDGRFNMCEMGLPWETPWHHLGSQQGARCPYLHQQLFDIISERTPAGKFIPRFCQSCWKIVIRPTSLEQLFIIEGLLIRFGWPSKCGIEKRAYTPLSKNLYGGYIYNHSMDEGLGKLDVIREAISATAGLDGVKCILKRACTEMELAFPDSSTWEVTDEQNRVEDILDWMIVYDVTTPMPAHHMVDKVHKGWIEWAAQHGDETYLKYTDGKRLYPEAVRYERKVEGIKAGSPDDKTVAPSPTAGEAPKGKSQRTTKEKK